MGTDGNILKHSRGGERWRPPPDTHGLCGWLRAKIGIYLRTMVMIE